MTYLFRNLRVAGYVFVFLLSGTVLGITAFFASEFLPQLHHDFTIFSLVVPSFTIFIFFILLLSSQPRIEAFFLFIAAVLWLTMGAWSADTIGSTECFSLGDQTTPTKNGETSARAYCYESKVIEAFSWAIFILLTFFLIFVITLANRSQVLGRPFIWREDINDLPWFGQAPGYPGVSYSAYPQGGYGGYPAPYPGPMMGAPDMVYAGGNVVQQQPGHSIVIQPGSNGMPAQVSQVPGIVHSA